MTTLTSQLKQAYKQLKTFYDYLPRDPELEKYLENFPFEEILNKIYAVGPYCWFLSDMKTGRWLKIGGALEQLTGYNIAEMLNQTFIKAARFTTPTHLLQTVESANLFWQYFYSRPMEHRPFIKSLHSYEFIRKDGSTFHALQQSSTVFFDKLGNGVYQFDLITDISYLDPVAKIKFCLLDSSDLTNMKQIPLVPGVIYNREPSPLSLAERKVLKLIAEGKSIKMIANLLNLSENTVKHHRTNMFDKCKVSNMAELVSKSISMGWF